MTHKEWSKNVKCVMAERGISVLQLAFFLNKSMEHIYKQLSGRRLTQEGVDEISKFLGLEGFEVEK